MLLKDKMATEGKRMDENPDLLRPQPRLIIPTRTDSQKVISKMKKSKFSSVRILLCNENNGRTDQRADTDCLQG